MAFERIDPMPDPWAIGAQICYVIACTMGGGKKKWKLEDFMPRRRERRKSQTVHQQQAIWQIIASGFQGGRNGQRPG